MRAYYDASEGSGFLVVFPSYSLWVGSHHPSLAIYALHKRYVRPLGNSPLESSLDATGSVVPEHIGLRA